MSSVWDRRNRRISYQVPVGVVDLQAQRVLNMSSINVSRGGIFVDTDESLAVGAPVVCNLPYGRDESAMQLRGRVAWLRPRSSSTPKRPGGVGIEFVDLSDEESDKLSDLVGRNEELSHQLSVKLPGLSSPVRGQAFLTPSGVFFRSKLPFLALDSDVEFIFEDEDDDLVYDGKIVGVEVFNDPGSPIPRLQVEIAVKPEDMPTTSEIPNGEEEGCEYEMMQIDTADTEKNYTAGAEAAASAAASAEALVIEIPQMIPIVITEVEEPSAVADEVPFEMTERVNPATRSFSKMWPPVALLVGSIVGILAFALSGSDETSRAAPQVPAPTTASSYELQTGSLTPGNTGISEAATQKTKKAEEAMHRIRAAALADQEELGDGPGQEKEQDLAEAQPEMAAPQIERHLPTPAAKPARVAGLQETIGGVKIWENEDGQLVVRLPIEGSLERATHYPLADPPGLAINLPYAQPIQGFHQSLTPHHDRIRTLWVRERLGGLHLRAFFDETAESCDVKYSTSAIVVRCGF